GQPRALAEAPPAQPRPPAPAAGATALREATHQRDSSQGEPPGARRHVAAGAGGGRVGPDEEEAERRWDRAGYGRAVALDGDVAADPRQAAWPVPVVVDRGDP